MGLDHAPADGEALAHKLELDPARPHYLLTEPGVGYRLRDDG